MKALTVRGSYRGTTGHDHQVREFVRELHRQGVHLQLIDLPHWSPSKLPAAIRETWFDSLQQPVAASTVLHFCMPHQVKITRDKFNVNFTMFEATRIPRNWVQANFRHDLVILPTASSQEAWVNSGFPAERIRLCPLGVDPQRFQPAVEPLPLVDSQGQRLNDYRVRVLNVSDLIPRKNLLGLLRVWLLATNASDDAVLIIKLNCGSEQWLNTFRHDLEALEARLGKTRAEAARIFFIINQVWPTAEMPQLYAAATHYWSMSRGEGWDMPMIEAGATGLALLAPWHSAYTAYLDETTAHLIPARRAPAVFKWSDGLHKLFQGAEWWEPDEATAADYIARLVKQRLESKSGAARPRITSEFTWEKATTRLITILTELEVGGERVIGKRNSSWFKQLWSGVYSLT